MVVIWVTMCSTDKRDETGVEAMTPQASSRCRGCCCWQGI